jgi:two-component system sensor histidine kinase HydH
MKTNPFAAKLPFKVSRAALGLILSTLFLAGLLTFSTLQNIKRERTMMERFFQQNGESIIKAIEAAMRTSMMHHMGDSDAVYTLLSESSRANDIVFIIITDKEGAVISKTDNAPQASNFSADRELLSKPEMSVTSLEEYTGILTITKRLNLHPYMPRMGMVKGRINEVDLDHPLTDSIISLGLFTHEFAAARKRDVQHAIFMGAILFLVHRRFVRVVSLSGNAGRQIHSGQHENLH